METATLKDTATRTIGRRDSHLLDFFGRRSDDALITLVRNHEPNSVLRGLQRFLGNCVCGGRYSVFLLCGAEDYVPTEREVELAQIALERRGLSRDSYL